MRNAITTLEQTSAMIRQTKFFSTLPKFDEKGLKQFFEEIGASKPQLEVANDEYYGFPNNTRFITITNPFGMQLLLAKDKDKLKIVWASFDDVD